MLDGIRALQITLMRISAFVLVILLVSCSQHEKPYSEPSAYEGPNSHGKLSERIASLLNDPVSGYVLVHHDALHWTSAQEARDEQSPSLGMVRLEGDHFHLHMPDSVTRSDLYNWGSPFVCRKVIEDHGDVVLVEALDDDDVVPEKLGHGGLGADYIYNLRTWVRKSDLVPVLTSACKFMYEDSTQIIFETGVAVGIPWNGDESQRVVSVHQMHFKYQVPDELLGLSYEPEIGILPVTGIHVMLDEESDLFVDGRKFCSVSEIRKEVLRTPGRYWMQDEHQMVELVSHGLRVIARTNKDLVEPYVPNNDRPVMTAAFPTPPRWYYRIDEGTTAYWEDGRKAGQVRQFFSYASTVGPDGDMWCEIHRELYPNIKVCFRVEDIEVIDNLVQED